MRMAPLFAAIAVASLPAQEVRAAGALIPSGPPQTFVKADGEPLPGALISRGRFVGTGTSASYSVPYEITWRSGVGGRGDLQIYRATRASVGDPFGRPRLIAPATGFVEAATVAPGGRAIYYHALDAGSFVLMRLER